MNKRWRRIGVGLGLDWGWIGVGWRRIRLDWGWMEED